MEINNEFDIDINVPFDDSQAYVIGYDTIGNGVIFEDIFVCRTQEEINDEAYRIIFENDLDRDLENLSLNERLVIAEIIHPTIKYTSFEVVTTKSKLKEIIY